MEKLENQECPACHEQSLTLMEDEQTLKDIGKVFVFGMKCDSCELEKADVELEKPGSKKIEFKIEDKKSLEKVVVRGGEASINIPELKMKITPDMGAKGYVGTVDDIIQEFIAIVKAKKDSEEDKKKRKKLFNKIDELLDVQEGTKSITIIIEDKSGNSAVIA